MIDLRITEEKRNELLGRTEIRGVVAKKEGTTPSRNELIKIIAEKLKAKEDHIEIDGVYQKFGKQEAEVKAKIWDKPIIKATPKKPEGEQSAQPPAAHAPTAEKKEATADKK